MLDRLVALFWTRGYDDTSHTDMREATGLSGSSLYNAFGDKRAIFTAVLRRYHDRTSILVAPLLDGTAGLDDIGTWVAFLRRQIESDGAPPGCLMIATMGSPVGRESAVQALTAANLERVHAALATALQRAAQLDEITAADTAGAAALLCAAYTGALATARNDETRSLAISMLDGIDQLVETWRSRN